MMIQQSCPNEEASANHHSHSGTPHKTQSAFILPHMPDVVGDPPAIELTPAPSERLEATSRDALMSVRSHSTVHAPSDTGETACQ